MDPGPKLSTRFHGSVKSKRGKTKTPTLGALNILRRLQSGQGALNILRVRRSGQIFFGVLIKVPFDLHMARAKRSHRLGGFKAIPCKGPFDQPHVASQDQPGRFSTFPVNKEYSSHNQNRSVSKWDALTNAKNIKGGRTYFWLELSLTRLQIPACSWTHKRSKQKSVDRNQPRL